MLNRTVLVGRMTKDVDLRYTQSGKAVGNFTIAVNRPFKSNDGQDADFINCTAWGKQAENLAQFMGKGSLIGVDGRIQTRSFDNQEGKRVFVTEVVADSVQFLESKGKQNQPPDKSQGMKAYEPPNTTEATDIDDSDLPF